MTRNARNTSEDSHHQSRHPAAALAATAVIVLVSAILGTPSRAWNKNQADIGASAAVPQSDPGGVSVPALFNAAGNDKKSPTASSGTVPLQLSPMVIPSKLTLPITVSFRTWNGIPTTDIALNDRTHVPCGFNTGLNANTINPAIVALLKLEGTGDRVRVAASDRETVCDVVGLKSAGVAGLTLTKVQAASQDITALISSKPHPDAPQFWLGTPFLAAFQVTFDFPASNMTISAAATRVPSGENVDLMPITFKNGMPYVSASILNGKSFPARVDTGTVITLIPGVIADKLQLRPLQTFVVTTPDKQSVRVVLARLQEIAADRAARKNILVAYFDKDAPTSVDRNAAVLGSDFFSRFKVVLSYKSRKLAIVAPTKGPVNPNTGLPANPSQNTDSGRHGSRQQ